MKQLYFAYSSRVLVILRSIHSKEIIRTVQTRFGFLLLALLLGFAGEAFSQAFVPNIPQANNNVAVIKRSGNTIYMGGTFTKVGNIGTFGAQLDNATGQMPLGYAVPNGTVNAAVADGAGGWYIGGGFSIVGNTQRINLAHINSAGAVDPFFQGYTFNSTITALQISNGKLYIGGNFTAVSKFSGRAALLNRTTAQPNLSFPAINGTVTCVASDGSGGWYLAGSFTLVGTTPRTNAVRINSNGTIHPWNPAPNSAVTSMCVSGGIVYLGGGFTSAGGQTRNRIAAINGTTGLATSWNPNANSTVSVLKISGSTLYAGGSFTSIGGQTRPFIAALDITIGLATAWNPNASTTVTSLLIQPGKIYAGGNFTTIGGQARNRLAALDATTGLATTWNPNMNGLVNTMSIKGNTLYAGGSFTTVGALTRNFIAGVDLTSGVATAWNPNANTTVNSMEITDTTLYIGGSFITIGGQTRNRIAEIRLTDGSLTTFDPNATNLVSAILVDNGNLLIGGSFIGVGGTIRNRLASIDLVSGNLTAWDPNANSTVNVIEVSGNTVYAGGSFSTMGAQTRNCIAAIDANSGLATSWNPNANSTVLAITPVGNTIYTGGGFTSIGGQARNFIAALDATTGLATTWNPNPSSTVRSIAVSGNVAYIGGSFTTLAGQARNALGAVSTTTGLATAWNPAANASSSVLKLIISGATMYVGGNFTTIGGQLRNRIAAIDVVTGLTTSWDPSALSTVNTIAVQGTNVYAGGAFSSIGGFTRNRIAAFDATTGNLLPWNPNANSTVSAISVVGNKVYVGGLFTTIGGQTRNRIAAINATTGTATSWDPNSNGTVLALEVSGSNVYAGGTFTTIGGQTRSRLAALDTTTGLATTWNPASNTTVSCLQVSGSSIYAGGGFSIIGGQTRNRLAQISLSTGLATSWNPNLNSTVNALALSGNTLYVGGQFTTVGGQARNRLAALDATTGLATTWNPAPNNTIISLALSGNAVYVGGNFTTLAGQTRNRIAAIDTFGVVVNWNPNMNTTVNSLCISGNTVFAGGGFSTVSLITKRSFVGLTTCFQASPDISYQAPVCAGSSLNLTVNTIAGATYSWTGPNNFTSTAQNPVISNVTGAAAGDYYCTVSVGACVSAPSLVTVDIQNGTVTASNNSPCVGQTLELSAGTTSTLDATYSWTGPNGFISNLQDPVIPSTTAAAAGTYTVSVVTGTCPAVVRQTSVPLTGVKPIITSSTTIICSGNSVLLDAGFGYNHYVWNGDQTDTMQTKTVSDSGSYTVTVTSGTNCISTSDPVTLTQIFPPAVVAQPEAAQIFCVGDSAALKFTVSGTDLSYQWFKGTTPLEDGGNISGANSSLLVIDPIDIGDSAYNYNCLVTGSTVCGSPLVSNNGLLGVRSVLTIVSQPIDFQATCRGTSASFSLTAAGSNPTTYQWFKAGTPLVDGGGIFGVNTATLNIFSVNTSDSSDDYYCVVTSPNSCNSPLSSIHAGLGISQPVTIINQPTQVNACVGNDVDISVVASGLGLTYQWKKGTTTLVDNATISGVNLATLSIDPVATADAGSYTVVITNSCGSITSATINVSVNPSPVVNATSTGNICLGSIPTTTINATGALTYLWQPGDMIGASQSVSPLITTNYTVKGTNANGCSSTASVDVIVNPTPIAPEILGNTLICSGSSASLVANGEDDATFRWYDNAVGGTILGTNEIYNTPALTVTDTFYVEQLLNGCVSTRTAVIITIQQSFVAIITSGGPNTFCDGDSVTLSANAGSAYQWKLNGNNIPGALSQSYVAKQSGNYTATVTGGCGAATSTPITITVNPKPTVITNNTSPVCEQDTIKLFSSPGASWLWTGPNGFTSTEQHPVLLNALLSNAGTYTVEITNTEGCKASGTTSVIVNALPSVSATNNGPACLGSSVTLSSTPAVSYIWNGPNGFSSTNQSPVVANVQIVNAGTYFVKVTGANGCRATASTTVLINTLPSATITPDGSTTFCPGGSVTLTAPGGLNYLWSDNSTGQSIVATSSGSYSVSVSDANGCFATSSVIAVNATGSTAPVAIAQDIIVYLDQNGTVSITAAQVDNGSTDDCGIANMTVTPSSFTCLNKGPNSVTLQVTDNGGYVSTALATVTVVDNIAPVVSTQNISISLPVGGTASITASQINNGSSDACGIKTVTVSPTSFGCTNIGANTVTLTVTDNNNNVSTGTAIVTVTGTDTDGDNIADACDADDDNDGITDASECNKSNFFWSNLPTVSGNTATGTINGIAYTYTSSAPVLTTSNLFAHSTFPVSYNVPNAKSIQNIAITNNTLTFASPMTNPVLVFASIGQGGLSVPIQFGAPVEVLWSANVVQNTSSRITGTEGYAIVRMNGTFSSITFNYLTAENYCNFVFGADFTTCGDTDADGIPDYLDTDSDNDGCIDAVEGSLAFLLAQTQNDRLTGAVDGQGIPVLAGSGQGNGTSQIFAANCSCQPNIDRITPIAIAQNISVNLTGAGTATITAAQINNGSNDACGIKTLSVSPSSFNCTHVGTNTVTLTVTDNNNNVSTATATVTVQDITPPNAIAQNITVNLDANGSASITGEQVNNGSSDVCGIASLVLSKTDFNCSNIGANTVTLTVTDVNGNVSTANAVVTIADNIAPVITCAADVTVNTLPGVCSATTTLTAPSVTDNCGNMTGNALRLDGSNDYVDMGAKIPSGSSYTKELWVYQTTAVNASNLISSLNSPFWIPSGHLQAGQAGNYTYVSDPATFVLNTWTHVAVTYDALTHTMRLYKNGVQVAVNTSVPAYTSEVNYAGVHQPAFSNFTGLLDELRIWTVARTQAQIQASMNSEITPQSGLVQYLKLNQGVAGNNNPGITTATDASGNNNNGTLVNFGLNGAVSNWVSGKTFGPVVTNNAPASYPLGSTVVTWTANDASGNTATCQQTVTVIDNIAPTINCPSNISVMGTSAAGAIVNYATPTANDNCSAIVTLTDGLASGSTFPIGTTTITYKATDPSGNNVNCSFIVTVTGLPPVIVCASNQVVNNATGQCGSPVSFAATETTGVPVSTITYSVSPGSFFPVGTTTVTATATNPVGTSSCTFTVTVKDVTAPVLSGVPAPNITANCNAIPAPPTVTANDNCSSSPVSYFQLPTVSVNTAHQWPADGNLQDLSGTANGTPVGGVNFGTGILGSNAFSFSGNSYINTGTSGSISGTGAFAVSAWVRTTGTGGMTIIEQRDNDISGQYILKIGTNHNGGFSAPGKVYFLVAGAEGLGETFSAASVNDGKWHHILGERSGTLIRIYVDGQLNATATTGGVVNMNTNGIIRTTIGADIRNIAFGAPANYFVGMIDAVKVYNTSACPSAFERDRYWIATDASMNTTAANQNLHIVDTTAPVIICPANITATTSGACGATVTFAATATDNCSTPTLNYSKASGSFFPVGITNITVKATDACGNQSICNFQVTVLDIVPPTVITQNVIVQLDAGGNGSTTATAVNNGSSDACGIATMTLSQTEFNCNNVGANTVTLTVTDVNGNISTSDAVVTVIDGIAPVAIAQNVTVQLDANGNGTTTAAAVNNGSSDACGIASMILSKTDFNCSNVGSNIVTLTVTDVNGNVSTTDAVVTVVDGIAPIAIAQNVTVQLNANGTGSTTAAVVNNGSSDACGIATMTLSQTDFNCSNVGINNVTLTVTDVNGNSSTADAVVTVVDGIAPVAIAQNVTVQLDANGNGTTTAAAVNNGSSDACGIASMTLSKTDFNCSNVGSNTVTLTVTDVNGNVSTTDAVVTVVDGIAPIAVAQNVTVQLDANGTGSTTATAVNNGSSDACGIATMTLSKTDFNCSNVGTNTVTLTVTDVNGNVSTADAVVTAVDGIAPIATAQNITVQLDASGNGSTTATAVNNGSSDACGIASLVLSKTDFNCSNVGTNTVTLTVTDVNGNISTTDAVVTVVDGIAPIAVAQNVT
ncbi:MAG: LamG-like jellyroll fold domain-containing protein, partial [Bacteroidota bacterium]